MSARRKLLWCLIGMLVAALASMASPRAHAREAVRIPAASMQYRMALERAVGQHFGVAAPVARVAAQLQQESGWNPKARSAYAEGLAQFTPATAAWLPDVCPGVGAPDPWDANWSIRAVACYDAWLHARAPGRTDCARWAMTLSAYNGGEASRDRERVLADKAGADPEIWFDETAPFRARSQAAWRENRGYVQRILRLLEPAYLDAGWPGDAVCA